MKYETGFNLTELLIVIFTIGSLALTLGILYVTCHFVAKVW